MKYYDVLAKCGHVGRNKYILKHFYVKVEDKKEAAKIVRFKPRVKHDHKYAIKKVEEITLDEYINGIKEMSLDMYFRVHNSKDQRLCNCIKTEDLHPEEKDIRYKKYWIADVKQRSLIDKYFVEFKEKEKTIEKGITEINILKEKLYNGEKEYVIHKYKDIGGKNETEIRNCIEYWKTKIDYSDYLKKRDKTNTAKLLKEIDGLSIDEIREKYFPVEVIENE